MGTLPPITAPELAERLAAERRGEPFLELREADGALRLVPLADRDRITIGRVAGNDVVLDWDREVSRSHLRLERVGPRWTAVDDGLARNGSFLNSARLDGRVPLHDRDVVRCGRTLLTFRDPAAIDGETIAAAATGTLPVLTQAQRRVLVALCRPLAVPGGVGVPASNREIADELVISLDGVKSQLKALFERLEIADLPQNRKRAELARTALTTGLVTARDLRDDG